MNKTLIQIGSAEGNDHVTDIIKNNIDINAILVEPNPKNFELLQENYKDFNNIKFENVAISTRECEVNLFVEPSDISHHGSINFYHLLVHNHNPMEIRTLTVKAITLEQLIQKYNIIDIEFLFIDTEGHDCDIILSTDFSKFNIKNICFETLHADGPMRQGLKLAQTLSYLEKFGYKIDSSKNIPWSTWVTRNLV